MKRSLLFVLIIFCSLAELFSQTAEIPFSYNKDKVKPGTACFYRGSDKDKGQAYEFIVYQTDEKTFLSFGDFSEIAPMVQIGTQKYNPRFSAMIIL